MFIQTIAEFEGGSSSRSSKKVVELGADITSVCVDRGTVKQ